MLRVVSGAGVVQIGPQAMDGEPLGPVQLSLTSKICGIVAYLKTVKIDPSHSSEVTQKAVLVGSGAVSPTGSVDLPPFRSTCHCCMMK